MEWKRSSFCKADQPMCVEVRRDGELTLVRDSKDSSGDVLVFDADEWSTFLAGVKNGEFD